MNKTELLSTLRTIVKQELKEFIVSKEGRTLLQEVISGHVRIEVDRLLTEMETTDESNEIIQESKRDKKLVQMVERKELPPKDALKKEVLLLSKNSVLNNMLNQTLQAIRSGNATMPSMEGTVGQAELLREQYNNATPPPTEGNTGKSVISMIPDKTVEGHPMVISADRLPDHVTKALTRDYRNVMKKLDEKRG